MPSRRSSSEVWSLELLWSLGFGAWIFSVLSLFDPGHRRGVLPILIGLHRSRRSHRPRVNSSSHFVVRIQRVRLADGEPVSFDETYLPREIGEKVVTNDLEVEPIFSLLEQKYDIPLVEAEYRLEAVSAEPLVAEALGVDTGSPLFLIERTSYCAGSRPIDYEKLYYRGDMIRFVTRLARRPKEGG